MSKVSKAGEPEKQCISGWVDQNGRQNINGKVKKEKVYLYAYCVQALPSTPQ